MTAGDAWRCRCDGGLVTLKTARSLDAQLQRILPNRALITQYQMPFSPSRVRGAYITYHVLGASESIEEVQRTLYFVRA